MDWIRTPKDWTVIQRSCVLVRMPRMWCCKSAKISLMVRLPLEANCHDDVCIWRVIALRGVSLLSRALMSFLMNKRWLVNLSGAFISVTLLSRVEVIGFSNLLGWICWLLSQSWRWCCLAVYSLIRGSHWPYWKGALYGSCVVHHFKRLKFFRCCKKRIFVISDGSGW